MRLIDMSAWVDQETRARLRYRLADHPLMTTQSLVDLALRIDPDYVRFHGGERQIGTGMGVISERALEIFHRERSLREVAYRADVQRKRSPYSSSRGTAST